MERTESLIQELEPVEERDRGGQEDSFRGVVAPAEGFWASSNDGEKTCPRFDPHVFSSSKHLLRKHVKNTHTLILSNERE